MSNAVAMGLRHTGNKRKNKTDELGNYKPHTFVLYNILWLKEPDSSTVPMQGPKDFV
jgi:hypothetical protein